MYDKIVITLKNKGATDERIESFIKVNDYNGKISYPVRFELLRQTWDAVERFSEIGL